MRAIFTALFFQINFKQASFEKIDMEGKVVNLHVDMNLERILRLKQTKKVGGEFSVEERQSTKTIKALCTSGRLSTRRERESRVQKDPHGYAKEPGIYSLE